jgi:hypothetical protein
MIYEFDGLTSWIGFAQPVHTMSETFFLPIIYRKLKLHGTSGNKKATGGSAPWPGKNQPDILSVNRRTQQMQILTADQSRSILQGFY